MKLAIGSDHAGVELKSYIKELLVARGHEVTDCGPATTDSVDYPEYGQKVARAVASGEVERGVVICGSGIGISIAANRIKGARAANCSTEYQVELSRLHNDANILALGARLITSTIAERLLDAFLNTPFEGERHARRVALLDNEAD